jgi:hypothetical protein
MHSVLRWNWEVAATVGEGLGAIVGPKPAVQVSCCVIIVAFPRSARVCVRTAYKGVASNHINFPAAKMPLHLRICANR